MTQPTHIRALDLDDDNATVALTEQHVWRAHSMDKQELIARALQADGRGLTIIFCRTKRNAQRVADDLADRGFAAAAVHGDLGQGAREQALRAFRNGKVDVLVATDVAARGIDVHDVTHVINWECPEDDKTYLHRIGRTGRAGASGVAITLVDWDDLHRWKMINQTLGLAFHDPIETYSSSPHVYTGLGIPEGTKGRLPKSSRTREGLDAEVLEDLGETGASAGKRNRGKGASDHDRKHDDKRRDRTHDKGDRHDRQGTRDASAEPREPKADRPPRERRRTRSGSGADATTTTETATSTGPASDEGTTAEGSEATRRRRRRGGRGRGGATPESSGSTEGSVAGSGSGTPSSAG
jgi:superfamily II DNA/RNA helicase